jgi:hypothetical protein
MARHIAPADFEEQHGRRVAGAHLDQGGQRVAGPGEGDGDGTGCVEPDDGAADGGQGRGAGHGITSGQGMAGGQAGR